MTIVSLQRNVCFLHFHKCGGTSVERAYESVALLTDLIIGSTKFGEAAQSHYSEKFGVGKHASADNMSQALGSKWKDLRKFALVRNHFRVYESYYGWIERVISYNAQEKQQSVDQACAAVRNGAGEYHFEKWGVAVAYSHTSSFDEFMAYTLEKKIGVRETYLRRMNHDLNKDSLEVFDLSEMDLFWDRFSAAVGTKIPRKHENKSRSSKAMSWSKENIDGVLGLFRDDFEFFGFEADPLKR